MILTSRCTFMRRYIALLVQLIICSYAMDITHPIQRRRNIINNTLSRKSSYSKTAIRGRCGIPVRLLHRYEDISYSYSNTFDLGGQTIDSFFILTVSNLSWAFPLPSYSLTFDLTVIRKIL